MKKLSLVTAFLLLLLLTACRGDAEKTASITTQSSPEEVPVDPAPEVLKLSVSGCDLSEYTIIYAETPYESRLYRNFSTEYDFYKLIAVNIAEKIYLRTGVPLPVAKDTATAESDREILVGPTNRDESDPIDGLDVFKTLVKTEGSKVVVGAGYDSTPYTGGL
ncbi:MAG: hypothetical protein IJW62_01015, partial [Clostridia bacterium]|nr:hypothetical protein [Clostridia bacterium]